jgi:quercetin dioxygenase-like cupin family protein
MPRKNKTIKALSRTLASSKQVGLPIALGPEEGDAIWSFGALATIKATAEGTDGRFALFEPPAPRGAGSPLHVHHNEDEWFYLTEGELTFWVNGKVIQAKVESFVCGPRDLPHIFEVSSPMARFFLGVARAGFENFMRVPSKPATARAVPPPTAQLPSMDRILAAAAQYGLEIIGPPGIPK